MTDSSPSSPFTGDNSKSPNDAVEKQSAADMLLQGNQELRASIVSNVITKGLVGLGVGVGLALFVFKRKAAPVMFTTGFGLGMSYAEGSQMVRDHHEGIRRRAMNQDHQQGIHQQTPPGM